MMKAQLENRLNELQAHFAKGKKELTQLNDKQTELRETLLRISGAIQVLQEELDKSDDTGVQPGSTDAAPVAERETGMELIEDTGQTEDKD